MLEIHCKEYLEEVKAFALSQGLLEQLEEQLKYMDQWGDGTNTCHVGKDFAPYSFGFAWSGPDGKVRMNGGLIYEGPKQPADGSFPSLTVSLTKRHGWFIHT